MNLYFEKYSEAFPLSAMNNEKLFDFGIWQLQELFLKFGIPEEFSILDALTDVFSYRVIYKNKKIIELSEQKDTFIFIIKGSVILKENEKCSGLLTEGNILFNLPFSSYHVYVCQTTRKRKNQ